jgi:diguanylate cyclase (GGDEF)-like protein/PAS domain S-box-containing protein
MLVSLLMTLGWYSGKNLVWESNLVHLRYEARLIADDLTDQIEIRLSALERLEGQLQREAYGPNGLEDELRHNDALLGLFDGLVVADAEGVIQADWPVVEGREGLVTAETDYFRFVSHLHRPYVSEPFIGRASETPLVIMVVPRMRDGTFAGFVGGLVDITQGGFFNRLRRIRLGGDGFAAVGTSSGRVLYHPDDSLVMKPVPDVDFNSWIDLARDGWEGEAVAPLLRGDVALQAYRQIWPADWFVGVFLPEQQIETPLVALFRGLMMTGVAIALILLPVMGWLSWLTLRPLRRLERQIEEVGEGQRSSVELDTHMTELSRVADTVNRVEKERSAAIVRLHERQAFLDAVLASSPVGMFVTDTRGHVSYMNPALMDLTGQAFSEGGEADWIRLIHPDDRKSALDLWRHSLGTGHDFLRQFRLVNRDGRTLWVEVHAGRVDSGDEAHGFVGTVKDMTEHHHEQATRRWEAEHDPLTGLLNRRGFERRLDEALAEWQKTGITSALLLFDLDHFKPINDEGGHALGDEMLRKIAQVIAGLVRRSDHAARQGGDEFAVLMPSASLSQAEAIAEALRQAIGELVVTQAGKDYRVTISLGITALRAGDTDITQVIERADAASYRAKSGGRNRIEMG